MHDWTGIKHTGKRRGRLVPGLIVLVVAAIAVVGCAASFDTIADAVLANEVRYDDREAPRTPYAIAVSGDAVQLLGGQGSGLSCSLPFGAQALAFRRSGDQAPIALQMRQACAFHDYCYRHGNATYGYSQADCDFMLQQQAFRLCKFINIHASISECETDARKVTIGVRLGGFGSFKRARALDEEKASTFLEFDPYPIRASNYRVIRVADAPRQWLRQGLLPKAAYHFDIRPSGTFVHILGWRRTGEMVCAGFALPASFDAMNGPPMVVRDAADGEDWFVWWKRSELAATHGRFALVSPGRATQQDWMRAAGGFVPGGAAKPCAERTLWSAGSELSHVEPAAFVTGNIDLEFSELHPVTGVDTPGLVRLMGLTTHSCSKSKADRSLCLVDVQFDTMKRQFREKPARYPTREPNCVDPPADAQPSDSCDRYRNYVGAPFVTLHETGPSLIWMRRGAGNGAGYENSATVRHYIAGKMDRDPAKDLGTRTLNAFAESMEPVFLVNAKSGNPRFISLVADQGKYKVLIHTPASQNGQLPAAALECTRVADRSWIQRPVALVQDQKNAGRNYLVFSRVRLSAAEGKAVSPAAVLELAVITVDEDSCSGMRETVFPDFFEGFAGPDEVAAAAAAVGEPDLGGSEQAKEAFGRFAARVRGGQFALADVTGDGVSDLVQVAKVPRIGFRTAVLGGVIDAQGLSFSKLAPPVP